MSGIGRVGHLIALIQRDGDKSWPVVERDGLGIFISALDREINARFGLSD
jgi:hypothetical protein